jgi:hypothetical protein
VLEIALQYQPEALKKMPDTVDENVLKTNEKSIRAH